MSKLCYYNAVFKILFRFIDIEDKNMMLRSFLPVGQGAFYLEQFQFENKRINVVYDCGSSTDINLVRSEITANFEKDEKIEFVFISHVDQDHINGLEYLLKYCNVKNIIFPYMTKNEKLLISIDYFCKDDSHSINDFVYRFINYPRQTINSLGSNAKLFRVINNQTDISEDNIDNEDIAIIESGENVLNIIQNKELKQNTFWEYVPYNFKENERKTDFTKKLFNFLNEINVQYSENNLDSVFLDWSNINTRNAIIKAYKKTIGNVNTNSMVVFSGTKSKISYQYIVNKNNMYFCPICSNFQTTSNGCLYTGDYDANGKLKWNDLKEAYKDYWDYIGCIQIPHHGSYKSYNKELSKLNAFYIVSAGLDNKYRHPSGSVIKDLMFNSKTVNIVTEKRFSEVILQITM